MDYYAQEDAADTGYTDYQVIDYDSYIESCETGRDSYSRYRSLLTENADYSNIAQALLDLGVKVSLASINHNYLTVNIDLENSELLDYREELIGSCTASTKSPVSGYNDSGDLIAFGTRVSVSAEDYGAEDGDSDAEFWESNIVANSKVSSMKTTYLERCGYWQTAREAVAEEEVLTVLNGVKATLKDFFLFDFVRPSNELALRKTQFDTHEPEQFLYEELNDYSLIPQFVLNDDGDIVDNYNVYQFYDAPSDIYLKHRFDVGVVNRDGGSGIDSHWMVSSPWPGKQIQIRNIYTDQCLKISGGELAAYTCDDTSYRWYSESWYSSDAVDALVYLHSDKHKNQCLVISDETLVNYSNSNKIEATECDTTNADQVFTLGDNNELIVNNICVDVPRSEAFEGQELIVYSCHSGANQTWEMNEDGTIQTPIAASDGSDLCLEAGDAGDTVDITLEVCDSSNPAQKFIPKIPEDLE